MSIQTQLQTTTDSKLLNPDAWEKLPDEPHEAYTAFLKYLNMGSRRSLHEVARRVLIEAGQLLPGQPLHTTSKQILGWSTKYHWRARVNAWDEKNWEHEMALADELRRTGLTEMVNRHIEGWQVISEAAIANFFERDADGNPIMTADGQPKVRVIEDEGVALRAYRQSVAGERTARGLPAEIIVMSTEDIKQRIVDINRQINTLQEADEDIMDGEYEELDEED